MFTRYVCIIYANIRDSILLLCEHKLLMDTLSCYMGLLDYITPMLTITISTTLGALYQYMTTLILNVRPLPYSRACTTVGFIR